MTTLANIKPTDKEMYVANIFPLTPKLSGNTYLLLFNLNVPNRLGPPYRLVDGTIVPIVLMLQVIL